MTVEEYFRDQMPAIKKVITGVAFRFRIDQQDLVQEILLRAWRKRKQYKDKGESGFMGWIWLMSYNEAINQFRVVKRRGKMFSLDFYDQSKAHQIADRYNQRQHLATIWRNLRMALGPRKALVMYMYSRGYKILEISDHLGMPDGTVKNIMFQCREVIETKQEETICKK